MPTKTKGVGRVDKSIVGELVRIEFHDHAENSQDAILFEAIGRVTSITPTAYIIHFWRYVDDVDRAKDSNPDNENSFAIVKNAVVSLEVLYGTG